MPRTVEAVYEGGVLRLKEPMALPDGTTVRVTVEGADAAEEPAAVAPPARKRTPAEIAARIAALPIESDRGEPFSGEDHDRLLYGEDAGR